jgi:hypothetical protein
MRYPLIFSGAFVWVILCPTAQAQSRIWTRNGSSFPANITAYQDGKVHYTQPGSDQAESLDVQFLKRLQFADGRINRFKEDHIPPDWKADTLLAENMSPEAKINLGWQDALAADQPLPGRDIIWTVTTIASPAISLIPTLFVANIGPHPKRYETAHPSLLNDPDYRNSFRRTMHSKKREETAQAFAYGTGAFLALWGAMIWTVEKF